MFLLLFFFYSYDQSQLVFDRASDGMPGWGSVWGSLPPSSCCVGVGRRSGRHSHPHTPVWSVSDGRPWSTVIPRLQSVPVACYFADMRSFLFISLRVSGICPRSHHEAALRLLWLGCIHRGTIEDSPTGLDIDPITGNFYTCLVCIVLCLSSWRPAKLSLSHSLFIFFLSFSLSLICKQCVYSTI